MPSVEDFKKDLLLRKRMKTDPIGALRGVINETVRDAIQELAKELIDKLFADDFLEDIANNVMSKIPSTDELMGSPGDDGEPGDPGIPGKPGTTPSRGLLKELALEVFEENKGILRGKDAPTLDEIEKVVALMFKSKKKELKGKDGKSPTKAEVRTAIRDIFDAEKASLIIEHEVKGNEIVNAINDLEIIPSKQIDAKHIKNLKSRREGERLGTRGMLNRGGLKLVWNVQLNGTIDGSNTVFTVPAASARPVDDKFIVASRGVLKDTDSGDFTVSADNRTVTFTSAPPKGSAGPRIIVYQAH